MASRVAIVVAAVLTASCTAAGQVPPAGAARNPSPSPVQVYVSSQEGDRLAAMAPVDLTGSRPSPNAIQFQIDDRRRFQTIAGFGATFNEAGLVALDRLRSRPAQDGVLRALFDPIAGAGFSVMKTPIAATDFMAASPAWYSYDDVAGDTSLTHFSIARDLGPEGLITYIRRARSAGGQFALQAPMDYPPDWMLVDPAHDQDVDPRYYGVLTQYYLKYLTAYEAAGVHVDYLSLFNEPGNYTRITMPEIRTLIRDHVGPALRTDATTTQLQLSEVAGRALAAAEYPEVLGDAAARAYIAVLPYHGYDGAGWDKIASLHAAYPDQQVWMTELCCRYSQSNGEAFSSGDYWGNTIISDLEAGASAWIYWNAILDQDGGPWLVSPLHGDPAYNSQNSVVVVDGRTQTVAYTGLYYYLAAFSRFVRPGAVRIESRLARVPSLLLGRSSPVRAVAFQNSDGSLVVELLNSSRDAQQMAIGWDGRTLTRWLPGLSITTLRWQP